MLRWRKKLLLAKLETTAGTAVDLAAADAVLAKEVEITPLAGDTVSREIERPYLGHSGAIQVNSHQTLNFGVELAGSGAAGTAPAWGQLLQACGMAEVVIDMTSVTYSPISSGEKTVTLGLNIDGQLHTLAGARGSFTLEINVSQIPSLKFAFTGLYAPPSSVAPVASPVYTAYKEPVAVNSTNTTNLDLHGNTDLTLTAFSFDQGNAVRYRESINNDAEVIITDRQSSGSVTVDAPTVSAFDFVGLAKNGGNSTMRFQHGVQAGGIFAFNGRNVQLSAPSYSEADSIWQIQASALFLPLKGSDEVYLVFR